MGLLKGEFVPTEPKLTCTLVLFSIWLLPLDTLYPNAAYAAAEAAAAPALAPAIAAALPAVDFLARFFPELFEVCPDPFGRPLPLPEAPMLEPDLSCKTPAK